jgi:hypothetical protein
LRPSWSIAGSGNKSPLFLFFVGLFFSFKDIILKIFYLFKTLVFHMYHEENVNCPWQQTNSGISYRCKWPMECFNLHIKINPNL